MTKATPWLVYLLLFSYCVSALAMPTTFSLTDSSVSQHQSVDDMPKCHQSVSDTLSDQDCVKHCSVFSAALIVDQAFTTTLPVVADNYVVADSYYHSNSPTVEMQPPK